MWLGEGEGSYRQSTCLYSVTYSLQAYYSICGELITRYMEASEALVCFFRNTKSKEIVAESDGELKGHSDLEGYMNERVWSDFFFFISSFQLSFPSYTAQLPHT